MSDNLPMIYVHMLGEFSITVEDKTISDQSNHSKKLWNLLSYLITYRNKELSQTELIDLLWGDEQSSNPNGALKTLMHRVRTLLKELEYPGEFILQRRGSYAWNISLPCVFDVDVFENYYREGLYAGSKEERLEKYKKAIAKFKGDFLPRNNCETWVIPVSAYYHNLYLKIVSETITMLMDEKKYAETANICWQALTIDQYTESLHYHLIHALYLSGNQNAALKQYSTTTELFFSKFGITPSDQLKALYKDIVKTTKSVETDLTLIKSNLKEAQKKTGAFFCEYEFFKDIYRLEARAAERTGGSIYICLITITSSTAELPETSVLTSIMEKLQETITQTLRSSDIYTRYSISQFLLMLPSTSYETATMVINRLLNQYDKKTGSRRVKVNYTIQPLDPF